jgi:hypothetical protein
MYHQSYVIVQVIMWFVDVKLHGVALLPDLIFFGEQLLGLIQ